ncbi:hypothetical protein ACFORL_02705 [Legionella dresdenensis]|uniref:Uncharacterized protein n=1 Tax=Legionella dresdenensis TaxID=450200 RepID=A0ABV8CD19_9GAMM
MIVQHIHQFMKDLSNLEQLRDYDQNFLRQFNDKFKDTEPGKNFMTEKEEKEAITWLLLCFEERWKKVFDKAEDYTFIQTRANAAWEKLGLELSKATGKPFLSVLMSTLSTQYSFNRLRDAEQDPRRLLIGDNNPDKSNWYKVGDLIKRLNDKGNLTLFEGNNRTARALSIRELWRIRNKTSQGSLWQKILNENHLNYEDRDLRCRGNLSSELIRLFSEMAEQYKRDVAANSDGKNFEQAFEKLNQQLMQANCLDALYFYGIPVSFNEKKYYLAEILINCLDRSPDLQEKLDAASDALTRNKEHIKARYFDLNEIDRFYDEPGVSLPESCKVILESITKAKHITVGMFDNLALLFNSYGVITETKRDNITSELIRHWAPKWRITDEVPHHLLSLLHNLIETYVEAEQSNNNHILWKNTLIEFLNILAQYPLAETNNFYSVPIKVEGKDYPILEIVLAFFTPDESLLKKLIETSRWLCQKNPSLIIDYPHFEAVYQELGLGKGFTITTLKKLIDQLPTDTFGKSNKRFEQLKLQIATETTISRKMLETLELLCQQRFKEVVDTASDYFWSINLSAITIPKQKEIHEQIIVERAALIYLAQTLQGAGLTSNAYQFLLGIRQTHISLTGELITNYPLSDYILSDDGRNLISLRVTVAESRRTGLFYNYSELEPGSTVRPKRFTHKEIKRLEHAESEYTNAYITFVMNESGDNPGIEVRTYYALKTLLDKSLHEIGWRDDYSKREQSEADDAYDEFWKFCDELPSDELDRLYNQRIHYRELKLNVEKNISVKELLRDIRVNNRCIAVYGKFLFQLVTEFVPWVKFRKDLEENEDLKAIRAKEPTRVLRDYKALGIGELRRRVLIITYSLLTHKFSYTPCTGNTVCLDSKYKNTVTRTGSSIFEFISNNIEKMFSNSGSEPDFYLLFLELMEGIVRTSLEDKSPTRYPDTEQWLRSIIDGTLFNKAPFFPPGNILTVLLADFKRKANDKACKKTIDDILTIASENKHVLIKWVGINICLSKYLESLRTTAKIQLLNKLRNLAKPDENEIEQILSKNSPSVIQKSPRGIFGSQKVATQMSEELYIKAYNVLTETFCGEKTIGKQFVPGKSVLEQQPEPYAVQPNVITEARIAALVCV